MTFGEIARKRMHILPVVAAFLALATVPQTSLAATAEAPVAAAPVAAPSAGSPNAADDTLPAAAAAEGSTAAAAPAGGGYTPLDPRQWIKGQPVDGGLDVQPQYSPIGQRAHTFHIWLVWIMAVISAFVLGLMLYTMIRFRRSAHPVPTKTAHNTLIEIIWTVVPVLVLVGIAIPSISLLKAQFESAPEDAVTIKVTGYQWYWGYTYPDNGGFEVISNMLPEGQAEPRGEPEHLGVDNRLVVPVGVPLRMQVTGADVIHAFAVPSLWFKIDAVPGRLNERLLTINEPGIYYGQCSELCGARHGYMPIAVEAVPLAQFEAFIRSKGGTMPGDAPATPAAAPSAAPAQQPESAVEGAPGAGAAPTASPAPAPAASANPA